jgi:hypothetical protein
VLSLNDHDLDLDPAQWNTFTPQRHRLLSLLSALLSTTAGRVT